MATRRTVPGQRVAGAQNANPFVNPARIRRGLGNGPTATARPRVAPNARVRAEQKNVRPQYRALRKMAGMSGG